jgi:hypothetical protein
VERQLNIVGELMNSCSIDWRFKKINKKKQNTRRRYTKPQLRKTNALSRRIEECRK